MKRRPESAGRDDDPRRRLGTAAGETTLVGVSSCLSSVAVRKVLSGNARRPIPVVLGLEPPVFGGSLQRISCLQRTNSVPFGTGSGHLCRDIVSRSAELGAEAAEILISPSGGVPAARGEAAAKRDRRDRERRAVRSRRGRGGRSEVCSR